MASHDTGTRIPSACKTDRRLAIILEAWLGFGLGLGLGLGLGSGLGLGLGLGLESGSGLGNSQSVLRPG